MGKLISLVGYLLLGMKFTWKFPIAILLITITIFPSVCFYPANGSTGTSAQDVPFFGITFGGNTTIEAKLLIDKVKGYTNLFVVDNWDIAMNETALSEICQYAYDANLYFIVYFSFIFSNSSQLNENTLNLFKDAGVVPFHVTWLSSANDRWGEKFLGAYVLDEPGGKQIDMGHYSGFATTYSGRNQTTFTNVTSYSDAANRFIRGLKSTTTQRLNNATVRNSIPNATGRVIPVFTADNALYWFDYLGGYDTVFAELGWNHNEAQHIALCRGAANVQDKQWGAIITWASNDPPYLESGAQMLEELSNAYSSGAKYLIVFNFPQINPYGALTEEHFKVLEMFWTQIHNAPRKTVETDGQVALVFPMDYGWGMRQANDRIWGLWPVDDLAPLIGEKIATLINKYGFNLDIIYDDPRFNYTEKYSTIYYWNGTTIQPPQSFFNLSAPSTIYTSVAVAIIALTCILSYFIIKNKKTRTLSQSLSQTTIQVPSSSKATLTNLGRGQLELVDNTIRFRTEKGYLRNRKEIIKVISVTDVENIKQAGSQLSVTWKGITEVFVIEEPALAEKISEKVNVILEEQRKILRNKEFMQSEIAKIVRVALEIVDSLFDVLRSLQKRIDWLQLESYSKLSEETGKRLMNQTIGSVNLDFSRLLLAVEKHLPKETSKETYDILRTLYEHFCLLASKNQIPDEAYSNYKDAKTTILAYYILNDIILSITVGEKDNQREINQLMMFLEDLPNTTDLRINISELKGIINKLGTAKENEDFVEESRMLFRQFINHTPSLEN